MSNYLPMLWETLFGFFALFILTKILGKTQISQLTAFDFISSLILGELVGNALFDEKAGIPEIAFVIFLWGGLLYLTEIISQKFKGTRSLIEGSPAIVIYNGKLIRDVMKKNKLDVHQLKNLLRTKDVFSIQEVEHAILETNGTVSVLKKSPFQTPSKSDMNVSPSAQDVKLATSLINDGEIIYDNLKEKNLTEEWLLEQLKEQDFNTVEEVFYAEYIKDKKLFVLPFVNRNHDKYDI
ncbi:YetF domain-containing protein [Virgibacillus sp. CBA3643]|uniref:YetF domain-containing protein n=1 Tax=Virgibacillus sp. CBA3643 TaxID=2942278 RepID=UPI0035A3C949